VIVAAASSTALGIHHARLSLDLKRTIDLEVAGYNDKLSFRKATFYDIAIARPRS
jgi:hypothetical protein